MSSATVLKRLRSIKETVCWIRRYFGFWIAGGRGAARAAEAPKNFADLIKPEFKGKVAVSGDETGVR